MSVTVAKLLVLSLLGLLAPVSGHQAPVAAIAGGAAASDECPMARAKTPGEGGGPALGGDSDTRFYGGGRRAAGLLP